MTVNPVPFLFLFLLSIDLISDGKIFQIFGSIMIISKKLKI